MSGARAKLGIIEGGPDGKAKFVGIFNSVSYSLTYDAQPAYILGRYSPAEIEYTAQEPVQITASGWRVIKHGPHRDGKVPALKDLLTHEYLSLVVEDRQQGGATDDPKGRIAVFRNVRPTGYSTTITARQLEEITVTFVGILVDTPDDGIENNEAASASVMPDV